MSVTTKDLAQAASRYLKANEKATSALSELGDLIWQAQEEDMAINEIARVTGLARSRVHYILNQQSKKRNEETKYNRAVSGSGGDKAFGPFEAGDETAEALIRHGAVGVLEWRDDSEPDDRTRIRFANGKVTVHNAEVIERYPDDPNEEPEPIEALYQAARTDGERSLLDDLRLRAGLTWKCECGWVNGKDQLRCDSGCGAYAPHSPGYVWVDWSITDDLGAMVGPIYSSRYSTDPVLFKDSDEALNEDTFDDHRWQDSWLGKVNIDRIYWLPLAERYPARSLPPSRSGGK